MSESLSTKHSRNGQIPLDDQDAVDRANYRRLQEAQQYLLQLAIASLSQEKSGYVEVRVPILRKFDKQTKRNVMLVGQPSRTVHTPDPP